MTSQEAQKRSDKAQNLKVWQVDDIWFYVESEDGKIAYKCCISEQGDWCNCGDFAQRSKNDQTFKCKHLLAVLNSIPRNEVETTQLLEKRKPRLDESFIKEIDNKDFVLYGGLLDVAHQKNLCVVDVELIQFPSDENKQTAICKAIVQTIDGKKFSDIGDANPMNCNSKVAKHLIRMASTRAKARALRDMDNIGMTCLEELADISDITGDEQRKPSQQKKDNVKPFAKPAIKGVSATQGNMTSQGNSNLPATGKSEMPNQQIQNQQTPRNEPPMANQAQPPVTDKANVPAETKQADQIPHAKIPQTENKTKSAKPPNGNGNGNGNGGGNGKDKTKSEKVVMMSEAQKSALFNLSRRRGISLEELEGRSLEKYGITVEQLTSGNAGEFIRYLQQSA